MANDIPENDILIRRQLEVIDRELPKLRTELEDWEYYQGVLNSVEIGLKNTGLFSTSDQSKKINDLLKQYTEAQEANPQFRVSALPAWLLDLSDLAWNVTGQFYEAMQPLRDLEPRRGNPSYEIKSRRVLLDLGNILASSTGLFRRIDGGIAQSCGSSEIYDRGDQRSLRNDIPATEIIQFLTMCGSAINTLSSQESLEKLRSDLTALVGEARGRLDSRLVDLANTIESQESRKILLEQKLARRTEISNILIQYALPAFGGLIVFLLLVPRVYSKEVQASIFGQGLLLEVLTVFLLTAAILILGLADKIPEDALGTLLGGISGYVLGRTLGMRRSGEPGQTRKDGDVPAPAPAPAGQT